MGSTGYAEKTIIFRGASMKNLKKKVHFRIKLKSKHLLVIMSIFCVSCIAATFSSGVTTAPLQDAAGILIVPFENSINRISSVLKGMQDRMRDKEEILSENENLKAQIDSLTEQNNKLIQDQTEYVRLQQMYNLDQQYTEYPKIAAEIISKDPGNWYDTFMINRGSADGIRVDNNVLADKGLVGIVTEVGTHWATVRSIIDDSSNVSAMTVSTQDNCVVEGDLELIDEGKLSFSQLYDQNNKVTVGERIVTSNISEKYVEGLFIGYVSEVEQNSNNLTKTGTIVTPVDFQHLKNVLVITVNKQDSVNDNAQAASVIFYDPDQFSSSVYSSSCDIHRFYHAESDPDPVYIHGADARKKKWTVDRIFLWISGRHVLWLCVWFLRSDLYVYWLFKRICPQDLL